MDSPPLRLLQTETLENAVDELADEQLDHWTHVIEEGVVGSSDCVRDLFDTLRHRRDSFRHRRSLVRGIVHQVRSVREHLVQTEACDVVDRESKAALVTIRAHHEAEDLANCLGIESLWEHRVSSFSASLAEF